MTRPIPGVLDLHALAALTSDGTDSRMKHFRLLDRDAQADAIRRLAAEGMTDHDIVAVTSWPIEAVRRALGERGAP